MGDAAPFTGQAVVGKLVAIMDQSTLAHRQTALELFRPKPDGSINPAGEAGWYLQRERERNHLTLEDVSATIGIHHYHLEAIEAGDLTGLPTRSEALGMIGAYAEYLGFDPQPLILHFANFLPSPTYPDRSRRKKKPQPLGSAKVIDFGISRRLRAMTSGVGGVVTSCLAAVMLFGVASYWLIPVPDHGAPQVAEARPGPAVDAQAVDELPVASTSKLTEEPLPDTQTSADNGLGAEADRAANALNGIADLIKSEAPVADKAQKPAKQALPVEVSDLAPNVSNLTPPQEELGGHVYGQENRDARLVLSAKAPVWLRIDDAHGNVIVTTTLNAGDSYRVPDRDGLVIISRDGGRIAYSIDGKAKGELGRPGEILVGRSLDLKKLAGL